MKTIKQLSFLAIIALLCTATFSCHNMCNDLEKTIGDTWWYETLEWKTVKIDSTNFSGATKYKYDSSKGVAVATGNGNWVLSSLGRDIKGYEVDVQLQIGSRAGIELFATNSYQCYRIGTNSRNEFCIYYDPGKTDAKEELLYKKKIDSSNKYNTIKAEIAEDRTMKVYFNGEFCYAIPDHKISYGLFTLFSYGDGSGDRAFFNVHKVFH